jgi:antirestriction protein ArdC
VRKGEKGRKVVFFKMMDKPTGKFDENGNEKHETIPFLSVYTVFKVSQCDGIEQKYHLNDDKLYDFTADDSAEKVANEYLTREGIRYEKVRGDRAFYRPSEDKIVTPLPEQFEDRGEYYSTLFHEMTHSTGHEKRLNRLTKCAAFGSEEYSTEELVAEIWSASLLQTLGISAESNLKMSAAYIKNWLKALKNDKKMIVVAAGRAEKAVRMILNIKENKAI